MGEGGGGGGGGGGELHSMFYTLTEIIPTSNVGEQFASGGSPEVHGAWSHAGHQVPTTGSPQLEQVLIPCSGL